MRSLPLCFAMLALFALTGFRASPKTFDQGFDDGYAVGYNTTCQVRGTHFHGDWDSPAYKRGYRIGLRAGVQDCLRHPRVPRAYERRWR